MQWKKNSARFIAASIKQKAVTQWLMFRRGVAHDGVTFFHLCTSSFLFMQVVVFSLPRFGPGRRSGRSREGAAKPTAASGFRCALPELHGGADFRSSGGAVI